jgi:hypothetical protein
MFAIGSTYFFLGKILKQTVIKVVLFVVGDACDLDG